MISIPNSEKRAIFKKGYVIIFFLSIPFLLIGFVIPTVANIIPSIDYGDPGYESYMDIISNLATISTLFLNLGLGLFLLSNFVGAMTEKRFSTEVKRGMLITSFLGLSALIISNYFILHFYIT